MAYESGLKFEQLRLIVTSDAFDTLEHTKGSYRNNKGKAQIVLSYQAADPSKPSGKKQVRLTHTLEKKYNANISDRAKRTLINDWKKLVLTDARSLIAAEVDPENTVRALCEQYVTERERLGETAGIGKGKGFAPTTAYKHRCDVKRLEGTVLYDMPLVSVTPRMAQATCDELCKSYSGESVRAVFTVLRQVFRWALGKNADSPIDDVVLPSFDWHPEGGRKGVSEGLNILSEKGLREFIGICVDSIGGRAEIVALGGLLCVTCGLRVSETCGLMWSDVHLDAPTPYVHVQRAAKDYVKGSETMHEIGPCKTKNAVRKIALMPVTADALRKVKANRMEALMAATPKDGERIGINDCYVLGDLKGNFRHTKTQAQCLTDFAERRGIVGSTGRTISAHRLRDTYASRLRDAGESDVRISKLMGHSSVAITRARYFDADQDSIDDAVLSNAHIFTPLDNDDVLVLGNGTEG